MSAATDPLRSARSDAVWKSLLACLGVAWILAAVMAGVSALDAHPDEAAHIAAGQYYETHWLPPEATETALLPSLSTYGYTYLSSIDASYFLAGRLARLVSAVVPDARLAFRAFNLLLLLILVAVYAARRDPYSPIVLLLVTPQVWYVFSYFNNDALPLFLSLLLADAMFGARGRVGRALAGPWRAASLLPLLGCGAGIGLLVLTKSNYLPFLAFLAFVAFRTAFGLPAAAIAVACAVPYLAHARGFGSVPQSIAQASLTLGCVVTLAAVAIRLWRSPATRTRVARGAWIALAAVAVAAPPLGYDRIVNGETSDKAAAMSAIAEKHAAPAYRPSNAAGNESFFGLRLRDKGVALHELLVDPWEWPVKSWKSFTGYYGYMKIRGPAAYYIGMFALYVALFGATARVVLRRGEPGEWQLFAASTLFSGGILVLSLYHSWINDFQAQGRYLFPVLALFAIPFTRASRLFSTRTVPALLGATFALSATSFVFIALRKIAKVWAP